jgi:type II secretory pathway pseudopilin PulG
MLLAREHRKVVLLGTVGLVLVLVLGVYSAFSGKAEQVEGVVQFTATATQAQKAAVRTACPTVGKAVLEPAEHSTLATVLTYPVRYDLTQASAAEQAAIYKCVNTQPGVIGVGLVRQGD